MNSEKRATMRDTVVRMEEVAALSRALAGDLGFDVEKLDEFGEALETDLASLTDEPRTFLEGMTYGLMISGFAIQAAEMSRHLPTAFRAVVGSVMAQARTIDMEVWT